MEPEPVLDVLATCGLTVAADRAAVAQRLGVVDLEGFVDVEDDDVDSLVRALARGGAGRGQGARVIPVVNAKNIKTALFWVKDKVRRGQVAEALDFTIGVMRSMAERKRVEDDMKEADPNDKPADFSGKQEDWTDFVDVLWSWAMGHKGSNGSPIAYIIRRIAPQGLAALLASENFVDVLVAECRHEGALFDKDNQTVFAVLSNCCKEGEAKSLLTAFRNSQNGVGAIEALAQHFAGSSGKARDLARARSSLQQVFYTGERSLTFDKFKLIMENDYQVIADSGGQMYNDEHKVTQVLEKMQGCKIPGPDGSNQFGHIASTVRERHLHDFNGAMNYMQDQISYFCGPTTKERRRRIGSVGTGGRGRDGRGGGRGGRSSNRGRGRGRGGRDRGNGRGGGSRGSGGRSSGGGRGGSGRVRFENGFIEVNGVRVDPNSLDNFTDEQVRQMGNSFAIVQAIRRNRNISVVQAGSSGNTVVSEVTNDAQSQANTQGGNTSGTGGGNRGGQNGRSFGPPSRS